MNRYIKEVFSELKNDPTHKFTRKPYKQLENSHQYSLPLKLFLKELNRQPLTTNTLQLTKVT